MDRNLRTRLQAARWLLDRVSAKTPEERIAFLRSETDDELLIELVEGLLENENPETDGSGPDITLSDIEMGDVDAAELLREINGIPRLLGEFELSRPVGRGGMGSVFLAEHRSTGFRHAVKVAVGDTVDADSIRSLFHEAEILQFLSGLRGIPACLPATCLEQEDQVIAYYAREFIRGTGIDDWVTAVSPDTTRVLQLAVDSCRIVESCHRSGVAHGDLKPSNILVGMDGDTVELIDFGLAVRLDVEEPVPHAPTGHPTFTAPEAKTVGPYDAELADQFSMGVTIYALLQQLASRDPSELPRESLAVSAEIRSSSLPGPIRNVLERMTRTEPRDRFGDLGEASGLLERVIHDASRPSKDSWKPAIMSGFAATVGVMILLAAALWSGWILGGSGLSSSPDPGTPSSQGDVSVALAALDGGDVAMASKVLSGLPQSQDTWLSRHLRARIRSIYSSALVDSTSSQKLADEGRFDLLLQGSSLSARDAETGELAHRWPAEPSWQIREASSDGALVETTGGMLDLDLRRAAASTIVSRDSLPGTLFRVGRGEIGWLSRTGMIVMHSTDRPANRTMPIPDGLNLQRASFASDGWERLVIVDGSSVIQVLGLGPRLGSRRELSVDAPGGLDGVVSMGESHFLLYGGDGSTMVWILEPSGSIREMALDGSIMHAESDPASGARLLVRRGDLASIIGVSVSGKIANGGYQFQGAPDSFASLGQSSLVVAGPDGLQIHSRSDRHPITLRLGSLSKVTSFLIVGPRSLLLGGHWNGLWVFDPVSNCLRGHIDTGSEDIGAILGVVGLDDVFTQDERGFIRRIPA